MGKCIHILRQGFVAAHQKVIRQHRRNRHKQALVPEGWTENDNICKDKVYERLLLRYEASVFSRIWSRRVRKNSKHKEEIEEWRPMAEFVF